MAGVATGDYTPPLMSTTGEFGSLRHLAERFHGALSSAGPPSQDERWALDQLLPAERELWHRMSGADRRHAIAVARESLRLLDDAGVSPSRDVVAAALLHDVGKIEAQLGTFARVAVTVAALAVGRGRLARRSGGRTTGWRARARLYVTHDRVGSELLRSAGSEPFTIAWTEQHHLPPDRWTVDPELGAILKAADGS